MCDSVSYGHWKMHICVQLCVRERVEGEIIVKKGHDNNRTLGTLCTLKCGSGILIKNRRL